MATPLIAYYRLNSFLHVFDVWNHETAGKSVKKHETLLKMLRPRRRISVLPSDRRETRIISSFATETSDFKQVNSIKRLK